MKHQKVLKKMTSLALAAALTFSLAACGGGSEPQKEAAGGQAENTLPEWVYVPEFLQIGEEEENISYYDMKLSGDRLYYTTYNWDQETETSAMTLCQYSLTDGTKTEIPLNLPEDASMGTWTVGADGSVYAAMYVWTMNEDGSGQSSRTLAKLDGQGNTVYANDVSDIFGDGNSYISGILADGQGRVYIIGDSSIWLFDEEGNRAGTVEMTSGNRSYINGFGCGADGKAYLCVTNYGESDSSTSLTEINFETRSLGEGFEDFPQGYGNGDVVQNADGMFLAQNGTTVYEYDPQKQERHALFDWLDCDINGSNVRSFGCLDDGRLVAVYEDWDSGDSGVALLTKTSSAEVPQRQQIVLATMYAGSSDIKAAAVQFNKTNDKYRVTIRGYVNEDDWSVEAYADALNRLNSDIASNNCPDIIDLSNVDIKQLAAKGAFEDLGRYLDRSPSLSREDLVANVLDAYTYDGVLVSIPDSFRLETVIGSTSQVGEEMGWTLEEMIAFADAHPGAELFDRVSKQTIMNYALTYNIDTFVDWNTASCNFDSDDFKKLLEFVNRFPNQEDFTYEEGQASEATRIQKGEVLLSNAHISELDEIQLYIEMFQGPVTCIGYPNTDGSSGCILTGNNAYAIAAKSNVKDGAWAFIEGYLTRESTRYRWGFPTNQNELNRMADEAVKVEYLTDENGEYILDEDGEPITTGGSHGIGYQDGWEYMYRIPTREEVDVILQLVKVAKPSSSSSETILNIINEESEAFFKGQKSADEVAPIIQSRVSMYVSENS